MNLPVKLRTDGIREALFELRFGPTPSPELTIANLLSVAVGFGDGPRTERLPIADVPAPVRRSDANLTYQPLVQIIFANGRLIRLGEQSISYHVLRPYPGWKTFKPELERAVHLMFDKSKDAKIVGLGLRYLNMLADSQQIRSVNDLNLNVSVATDRLACPFALHYRLMKPLLSIDVRVAASELVQGTERDFNSLVDIDVRTLENFAPQNEPDVIAWIEKAHDGLKECFFSLLKPETVEQLS